VPPQGSTPTVHDQQRTVTYSLEELELRPGGAPQRGGGAPVVPNNQMQTIAPGSLSVQGAIDSGAGSSSQVISSAAAAPNAAGLHAAHTMVNEPGSAAYNKIMGQPVPAQPAPGSPATQMTPAITPQMLANLTQRHPAVQRLPHEEVHVDVRDVQADYPDNLLEVHHAPDSQQAAAYRVLGHRATKPVGVRTVLITSAEEADGKTTCAINLGLAMSEFGRATVLLVEANLRSPAVADVLGFKPPKCFDVQLKEHKQNPMGTWTIARVTQWFHAVAVDPDTFTEPRLIDALALELAVEHFKRLPYDYILIDTPSVLGQADVSLIHDCADGILMTGIARESSGAAIREATQLLAPANILGIVLLGG
jgi:Mrp family chromosome partitioning ATPase